MQEKVDTSCMEIEETDVLIEGTNPFGVVLSSKLKIRELLKRAHPYDAECRGEKTLDDIRKPKEVRTHYLILSRGAELVDTSLTNGTEGICRRCGAHRS